MRRQQGMRLDDRYVPYLQMAGLYHLARLNDRWFRLDEALVSAFVERWRPETHTFHMPFGECTLTLQDVAYQLGLPVDGHYVSGCLSEFHIYIQGGRPAWETFGECPEGVNDETVRRYARAYIMMLLGTQLFADKSGNRIHIRWLPYVARLEEMGTYSWGSATLAWLYRCMCRVANRHVVKWLGYNPSSSEKGPRVQMWRLRIDRLQDREVVHPEALEPWHMALWRSVTSLIYFAVIEWHKIDRVDDEAREGDGEGVVGGPPSS
ncbi:protein MAIN-LIKE 2-like [Arachis duranensis]|uniref:Protein MAIN-LIKE 2-like n=1 Tax=Arachis duranensis TaxID=130453 RepID=A0A6P4DUE5_ARADU|nr:protein MAIN-LIKE 2-like [Arachis duranensis]